MDEGDGSLSFSQIVQDPPPPTPLPLPLGVMRDFVPEQNEIGERGTLGGWTEGHQSHLQGASHRDERRSRMGETDKCREE